MLPNELAQRMYKAYGLTTNFKNYQGLPMPEWATLTDNIRSAWEASARQAISDIHTPDWHDLDEREHAQVMHAVAYAQTHSKAGVSGHSAFMLIAKLAEMAGVG